MIIWGWGKVTRKFIASVMQNSCSYCNTTEIWQLCVMRTWFTLFFIPIIPYRTMYCLACPNCGSYIKLTKEQYDQIIIDLANSSASQTAVSSMAKESTDESVKYAGKTETQINFLKQMEEYNNRQ